MYGVFCNCCCSLIGYFANGIAAAKQRYGDSCPFCSNPVHTNRAESARQRQAHVEWAKTGRKIQPGQDLDSIAAPEGAKEGDPVGHPFSEFEGDEFKQAPQSVQRARKDFIAHVATFQRQAEPGESVELD